MAELLKERNEIEECYKWDLSTLFNNDEEWAKALTEIDAPAAELASYRGKLNNAETIHEFLVKETELTRKVENLFTYASLRRSEDTRAEEAAKMYNAIMGKYVALMTATSFATPEILSLDEDKLRAIINEPLMADYRFMGENLLLKKPHTLSAAEEQLLASFGEVIQSPGEIYDSLQDSDMLFANAKDSEGNEHEVTGSNYILLQSNNDRELRRNAFMSFYDTYRKHINTLAGTYSANVKAAVTEARVRHYESSRAMSTAEEHVPGEVYDNLIASVHDHFDAMYRYVRLRKRLLGVDELHYYDVYAPLVKSIEKHYSYEEAQQMVIKAVTPLGKDYVESVKRGFADRWIDVYPNKGKSGGAYSSGSYDSNPYIMCNFTGTLDSVSTIAHEMGHSQHTWLSKTHQPPQYAGYTLFVAEVASTVNENLMIEQLLQNCDDPEERLSLLNQYLENFKGTVYRQTMFAEFEREAHAMAERGEALIPSSLNGLYKKLIADYFGPDMAIDEEVQFEWARIPHFYRPFYVYKYATSYSSAVALSQMILNDGEPAVKKYLEFLSMGGSAYPLDELKHAGVDLTTRKPIDMALDKFAAIVEEAEKLADQLGK